MSALPLKAEFDRRLVLVGFVPKADILLALGESAATGKSAYRVAIGRRLMSSLLLGLSA
jgi:hypothetical protein